MWPVMRRVERTTDDSASRLDAIEVCLRHAIDDRGVLHIHDEVGLRGSQRRRAGLLQAAHVGGTQPALYHHEESRLFDDGSNPGHGKVRSATVKGKNCAALGNTNHACFETEGVMPNGRTPPVNTLSVKSRYFGKITSQRIARRCSAGPQTASESVPRQSHDRVRMTI